MIYKEDSSGRMNRWNPAVEEVIDLFKSLHAQGKPWEIVWLVEKQRLTPMLSDWLSEKKSYGLGG